MLFTVNLFLTEEGRDVESCSVVQEFDGSDCFPRKPDIALLNVQLGKIVSEKFKNRRKKDMGSAQCVQPLQCFARKSFSILTHYCNRSTMSFGASSVRLASRRSVAFSSGRRSLASFARQQKTNAEQGSMLAVAGVTLAFTAMVVQQQQRGVRTSSGRFGS